ncbi:MAG: hypothetical protein CMN30_12700 [Sandaracinus sp.]|nr:hypothetical protein [Sandaracinus sp.]
MPFHQSPYARDAKPTPPLPEPETREAQGYVAGTGGRARRVWAIAFWAGAAVMALLTGVAGYGSETAGVAMAYLSAAVLGFAAGGYAGVVRAQRAGPRVGGPLPYVAAVVGMVLAVGAALLFFEGIWPAL